MGARKKSKTQRKRKQKGGIFQPKNETASKVKSASAIGTASAIGALSLVSKIVVSGAIGAGLTSPAMPAVAVLLLVANKLANIYKANANLSSLMYDIMNILCNMYHLNKLIDKSIQIFYTYIFQHHEFEGKIVDFLANRDESLLREKSYYEILKLNNIKIEEPQKKGGVRANDPDLSNLNQEIANSKIEPPTATPVLEATTIPMKIIKPEHLLVGRLYKNQEVDDRLYIKVTELTKFLAKIIPTETLQKFLEEPFIKESQFGILLSNELEVRVGKPSNGSSWNLTNGVKKLADASIGSAVRVFKRTMKAKSTIDIIVQNLSVINGFYALMKSQYDFQNDYYSRTFLPEEYNKIWSKIEETDEYIKFMLPPGSSDAQKTLLNNSVAIFQKEMPNLKYLKSNFTEIEKETNADEVLVT